MARDYPLSKTQETVLKALGMTATGYGDAERQFERLGLVVSSKRQGRATVPVITVKDRESGGFSAGGDGFSFTKYPNIDVTAITQWIEK